MTSATSNPTSANPNDADALKASFDHCRTLTRNRAKNFYYGMKLTPEPKRSAMYAIYAWMRAADDLADDDGSGEIKTQRLDQFRHQTQTALKGTTIDADLMWPAVSRTLIDYAIPMQYLSDMIDGQLQDLTQTGYDTFEQLYGYCYKVASVVGLTCITVWGYEGREATEKMAEKRGVALQLTNILRDLVEDAERGRIYLSLEDLAAAGLNADTFIKQLREPGPEFDRLMNSQIDIAKEYYEVSADLEQFVEPNCRPTCWAMMRIYRRLLDRIAANPRRVLTERVRISRFEKMRIAMTATMRRGLGR